MPTPALLGTLLLLVSPARAEWPDGAVYAGLHGGANVVLTSWDLGKNAVSNGIAPRGGANGMGGLRLGYQVNPQFAAELGLGLQAFRSNEDVANKALEYDVTALYHLTPKEWAPMVLVGAGAFHQVSGDLDRDLDPQVHIGLGVRGLLAPWLALRLEARDVLTDSFGLVSTNLEVRGGLDFFFGTRPPDEDGDGITDKEDACPTLAGVATGRGCPDRDADSIPDSADACPEKAGSALFEGCADTDGDGLPDPKDRCPEQAGPADLGGCPDKDGDGVADPDDRCVEVRGVKELAGCPDGDGDGIADGDDACPQVPGHPTGKGCPDKDGDGVLDKNDKCPTVAGLPRAKGCLPAAVAKFTGAIKGITFKSGSAEILPDSYPVLNKALDVLKKYPELRLSIEGHTDDVGDDALNQKLSEDRAAAVKAWFVEKGVDAARLETKGWGETKPVAPNDKPKGRKENRRIEFRVLAAS